MSGSIQSSNYVPGVSGWKINSRTGEYEINSCTLGSAASAPERQMVSVEVASWSKYDLPKNAANLIQFMQAELKRVPEQYRHDAEFEEFDASYGDESFNSRLFLSYSRIETEEELEDRLEKANVAGTRINLVGGVLSVSHDGVLRARIGNLQKDELPQPFVVVDGQVFVSQALVVAGMLPIKHSSAEQVLDKISTVISESSLAAALESPIPGIVRDTIRDELRPGGLLHRSR